MSERRTSSFLQNVSSTIITSGMICLYGISLIHFHSSFAVATESHNSSLSTNDDFMARIAQQAISSPYLLSMKSSILGSSEDVNALDLILFGVLILLGMELLNQLVKYFGKPGWMGKGSIPVRGKHLDELSANDIFFIGLNKAATPPFTYFLIRYIYNEPNAIWDIKHVTLMNTLAPIPILFVIYDFFYTILHWALHIKAVYGYIHKHHHHQKAPSRAQVDAVNVHPIEFFLGEYNHLFTIFLLCNKDLFGMQLHVISVILFIAVGGGLASLNHTRYDVVFALPFMGKKKLVLYDSKNHDVHHRIPQSNYGQYIMLWDSVFGSYRAYNEKDRVNPRSQLDPKTGKSLEYMEKLKSSKKIS